MKYMLDIALIIALLWIGWLWNGEKQIGLELSDEIDTLKAQVARVDNDLTAAKAERERLTTSEQNLQAQLDTTGRELLVKTDLLKAKEEEAEKLKTDLAKAVTRIKELQGYKEKAIVAEMPAAVKKAE